MPNQWSTEGALAGLVRTGLVAVLIPLAGCATAYQRENVTGGALLFRHDGLIGKQGVDLRCDISIPLARATRVRFLPTS